MNFMGAVLLCASTENVAPIEWTSERDREIESENKCDVNRTTNENSLFAKLYLPEYHTPNIWWFEIEERESVKCG